MTDRQFDTYQQILLRDLLRVEKEITNAGYKSAELELLIKDLEAQLKRP